MSFHYPYRAIICGEENIIKGWRGKNLVTEKGEFLVRHIYRKDWKIEQYRIFEIVTIRPDDNRGWLINGKPLKFLESLRFGARFSQINKSENLRVFKKETCAVAWLDTKGDFPKSTELLDEIVKFWELADKPEKKTKIDPDQIGLEVLGKLSEAFLDIAVTKDLLPTWSQPICLRDFRVANMPPPLTPEQKAIAQTSAELKETKARLLKAEAAAGDTLKEALSKWMRFDPPGMSVVTKAKIEKAVKMYITDTDKQSLAKIAKEFKVSRTAVSKWFSLFTKLTHFPVARHQRHESVSEHTQSESEDLEDE